MELPVYEYTGIKFGDRCIQRCHGRMVDVHIQSDHAVRWKGEEQLTACLWTGKALACKQSHVHVYIHTHTHTHTHTCTRNTHTCTRTRVHATRPVHLHECITHCPCGETRPRMPRSVHGSGPAKHTRKNRTYNNTFKQEARGQRTALPGVRGWRALRHCRVPSPSTTSAPLPRFPHAAALGGRQQHTTTDIKIPATTPQQATGRTNDGLTAECELRAMTGAAWR